MRKATLNFLIEGVTFANLAGMTFTGLILEFTLPPGSHAARQLGLTRHEWGTIHFYLSLFFLALLAAHLILHWRWIRAMVNDKDPSRRRARAAGFLAAAAVFVLAAGLPWILPIETSGEAEPQHRGRASVRAEVPADSVRSTEFLRGRSTLAEVSLETGLGVEEIKNSLGLPSTVQSTDRFGPAVRARGMEVREALERLQSAP